MNTFVARFLLAICLFSFTPMKEFIKIPMLVSHYMQHAQDNPSLTIIDFLDLHYMHGIVLDEDYEEDMQLPFKVVDYTAFPFFILNECKEFPTPKSKIYFCVHTKINTANRFAFQDANYNNTFHPPKYISA